MKQPAAKTVHVFVDEAGDPTFYGKGKRIIVGQEGCSRTLMLGFVEADDPEPIRKALNELRQEIANDRYFAGIPSVQNSLLAFHAKDDCPELRMLVYKALAKLPFSAQVIVARKRELMFRTKYQGKEDLFYDDLVTRLFVNRMHLATEYQITFSRRGSKTRQHALRAALDLAIETFRRKWNAEVQPVIQLNTSQPQQEPCLQAIDYVMWAVQRSYERGEMRFFETLREKYSLIHDVFDTEKYKGSLNYYRREENPFDIKKVSPLG